MIIELQLQIDQLKSQAAQAESAIKNFGSTVESQGSKLTEFKRLALGVFGGNILTQGIMGLQGVIKGVVEDTNRWQATLAKTNAIIQSTGGVAGVTTKALEEQAHQLQQITKVDEQVILNGENVMATFTNVRNAVGKNNDVFNQATKAALDISSVMGEDLVSANVQLGKALSDPILGMTALHRIGVTFTAQQKEQIKTMVDSGNTLGAQKVILQEVNREFGGAAKAAGETFGAQIKGLILNLKDFGKEVVARVIPVLQDLGKIMGYIIDTFIKPMINFIKQNSAAIEIFVGVLGTAFVAYKTYTAVMAASKLATEAWYAATLIAKGVKIADIAVTEGLTGAMTALDAVMNANPIMLVVAAAAALAAGFVILWNHSETFRKIIVGAMQQVIKAVGFVIGAVGDLITAFLKFETGPLRAILKVAAALHFPGAKDALNFINDGIKDVGNFFDGAKKKVDGFADNLDSLKNKKIALPDLFPKAKEGESKTPLGAALPQADDAAKLKKDATAAASALKKKHSELVALEKKYTAELGRERVEQAKLDIEHSKILNEQKTKEAEALKSYNVAVEKINEEFNKSKAKLDSQRRKEEDAANDAHDKAAFKAFQSFNDAKERAESTYADASLRALQSFNDAKARAQQTADDATVKAIETAADKQQSIVQKSMDLLRNAFAGATKFSLADLFKTDESADKVVVDLKDRLAKIIKLQQDAGKLAAAGYSQNFIQEVVAAGPDQGDQMAQSILTASKETQDQLKDLYKQVNDASDNGMNDLAKTMNSGGHLATQALIDEYNAVPLDLAKSLTAIQDTLRDSIVAAQKTYDEAMASAAKSRDESIADAQKTYNEAMASINEDLKNKLADIKEAYDQNLEDLTTKQTEALADAGKSYKEAIAQIAADTKVKLDDLQTQLDALLAKIRATQTAMAGLGMSGSYGASTYPNYSGLSNGGSISNAPYQYQDRGSGGSVSIYQNITNTGTDTSQTTSATLAGLKYGSTQVIATNIGAPTPMSGSSARAY
jgi:hypothetical protein